MEHFLLEFEFVIFSKHFADINCFTGFFLART